MYTGITHVSSRKLDCSTESSKSTSVTSNSSLIRVAAREREREQRSGEDSERYVGSVYIHLRAEFLMMLLFPYQYCRERGGKEREGE